MVQAELIYRITFKKNCFYLLQWVINHSFLKLSDQDLFIYTYKFFSFQNSVIFQD